jgi:hypothetical protein
MSYGFWARSGHGTASARSQTLPSPERDPPLPPPQDGGDRFQANSGTELGLELAGAYSRSRPVTELPWTRITGGAWLSDLSSTLCG